MIRLISHQQSIRSHMDIRNKILDLQCTMRIQDWDVVVSSRAPEAHDSLLEIAINRKRKHAAIRISDQALLVSSEEFDHCLIHELTHLIFDELDYEFKSSDRYEELRERAVDHIAKILYTAISQLDMPL